jgi:hypothetical protein
MAGQKKGLGTEVEFPQYSKAHVWKKTIITPIIVTFALKRD